MRKLENKTLQDFLDNFVVELKRWSDEFDYDIPFIISTLYQSFDNETENFYNFIHDLEDWNDYGFVIEAPQNTYDGIIDVTVVLGAYGKTEEDWCDYTTPGYNYKFSFSNDERMYGYCTCSSEMDGYREDKGCCGCGCDAIFCSFEFYKVTNLGHYSWVGIEKDYWDFEDEFYADDKELAHKREEENRMARIGELIEIIENAKRELAELENR